MVSYSQDNIVGNGENVVQNYKNKLSFANMKIMSVLQVDWSNAQQKGDLTIIQTTLF